MDRHDACAAADLVKAHTVIPCHYDTFPPIETDANAFKSDVEGKTSYESRAAEKVVILAPGETHTP
jgi:L-ascorbate metabolism protein UlaG (beta-lactamase superfamily)